jgi:phenylpropionate dioxygenase-like ring-hydroxylating dioxygenase large terminal subunit
MNPRFPFSPYPSGWFAIARSGDLLPQAVLPLRFFGQELVLFRTEDGQARLAEAFCPHLGAHLGHGGTVQGQSLRCPFHGWCFDGESGSCTEIPFARKIPPRARITTWPVREVDGMVLVYRDGDLVGQPPGWEVPSVQSDEWTGATYFSWKLRTCCQEILENTVDAAHLPTVHAARRPARYVPPELRGRRGRTDAAPLAADPVGRRVHRRARHRARCRAVGQLPRPGHHLRRHVRRGHGHARAPAAVHHAPG